MKHLHFLIFFLLLVPILGGYGSEGSTQGEKPWALVWEDNFDKSFLNTEDWAPAVQGLNWNNEDQAYISDNVTVENGILVLTAKHEAWTGLSNRVDKPDLIVTQQYTSGELNTKRSWTYGKFEFRAKFPKAQGILSALWMTPLDKDWPPEIDVVEMLGHDPRTLHFTNHYGTPANHRMNNGNYCRADFSEDYHIYAVEWEPGVIRWYVDGVKRFVAKTGVPSEPFIVRMSLPIGPDWEGNPGNNSVFPKRMEVDWVRVYQRL